MKSKSKKRAEKKTNTKPIPIEINAYLKITFDNTKDYYHPCLAIKYIFFISKLNLVTKSFLTNEENFSLKFFEDLFNNQYVNNIFLKSEMKPKSPSPKNFYNIFTDNKDLYSDILESTDKSKYNLMIEFLSDEENYRIPFM
jgi:hypothetical protein